MATTIPERPPTWSAGSEVIGDAPGRGGFDSHIRVIDIEGPTTSPTDPGRSAARHLLGGAFLLAFASVPLMLYKDLTLLALIVSAMSLVLLRRARRHRFDTEPDGVMAVGTAVVLIVFVAAIVSLAVAGHFFTELHRELFTG